MSLRHRRSGAFEVLAVALAGLALSCGDDEPARDQAVFWLQMGTQSGGPSCLSNDAFNVPDQDARSVITGTTGNGERLVDGSDGLVQCSVAETGAGQYALRFELSSGAIGNLQVTGSLTKSGSAQGEGTFNVNFTTTSFSLQQTGCTGTVKQALAGAVWLDSLSCPSMKDPSSPQITCTGNGGLIAENCAR